MTAIRHEKTGGRAAAEGGLVVLDGPGSVAVAMTPDAARETAQALIAAAEVADGQEPALDG